MGPTKGHLFKFDLPLAKFWVKICLGGSVSEPKAPLPPSSKQSLRRASGASPLRALPDYVPRHNLHERPPAPPRIPRRTPPPLQDEESLWGWEEAALAQPRSAPHAFPAHFPPTAPPPPPPDPIRPAPNPFTR